MFLFKLLYLFKLNKSKHQKNYKKVTQKGDLNDDLMLFGVDRFRPVFS